MSQVFIMLVGFSQSGKSTLSEKIQEAFPNKFIRIDPDSIHVFLNKTFPIFQDDNTIQGKSFALRQKATEVIKNTLCDVLLKEGYSIILDSCNLVRTERKALLTKAKKINKDISTIILDVQIPEAQLYKRLRDADQRNVEKGEKPAWIDLYEKIQKNKLVTPQETEGDYFLIYSGKNLQTVLDNIVRIGQTKRF